MKTTKRINLKWCEYDQVVGACQLKSFGVIFLDEYGCPIDNEYEIDEILKSWHK